MQNNVSEWPILIQFIQCNKLEQISSAKTKPNSVNQYILIFGHVTIRVSILSVGFFSIEVSAYHGIPHYLGFQYTI